MENIIKFIKSCFSAKTGYGRTIRTALQAVMGISVFVVSVLTIPGVQDFVSASYPNLIAAITTAVTISTAVWNGLEKLFSWADSPTEG